MDCPFHPDGEDFPAPTSPEYHFLVRELVTLIGQYTADILEDGFDLSEEEAAYAAIAWRLANIIYPTHGPAN